ncbi:MAG: phosphoribosylformylglycinamidine synthase [Desulfobacterales bacterium]|nr:phosphoribosylformylglycinamidine synthase [Desulfobacterales bacterium]
MTHRLEISLKPELFDAEGYAVSQKAKKYFGINAKNIRVIHVLTIDADIDEIQLDLIKNEIFTNPVTQISSYDPLNLPFDWLIWVGFRPGVRDNPGSTAVEAIEDMLNIKLKKGEAVYTSKIYCVQGNNLKYSDIEKIASELLANDIIQKWQITSKEDWNKDLGIGFIIPKVVLDHTPSFTTFSLESDDVLDSISKERNLSLSLNDIPVIRKYFLDPKVKLEREAVGLSLPTDVELEYISQSRSDHCNHNTFRGIFHYIDKETGKSETINSLFKTFIESPTLKLQQKLPWVISVLWDNAGIGRFDEDYYYTITGETHNSPSNMEAYGGSITGIVGVYRDPMGTGKGSKLIMGGYGFCVGPRDYNGSLKPRLFPRRLLDGIIEGVKDGGNKSGIPTIFGQTLFDHGYLGKCLVFVTSVGIMPALVNGEPSENKKTSPGDLIIMSGGRVGKDGIHGVTASSSVFSENTPAGHVQIGDPYTQKKMHDFLLEARDEGLISFITDNGGGGLSSSVGESARYSDGCEVDLDKVPLKYDGLDQWEIWISESQERMTIAVNPINIERFLELSKKHNVESTVIGTFTNSGKLHLKYKGKTCAYINMDFLSSGFPSWEFEAEWISAKERGLNEPVFTEPKNYEKVLKDILARPNIASKEWITRQYDHEVQGTSVIKPLVGVDRDVNSDASVIRPILSSEKGIAYAQAIIPFYSEIDAYHMTSCTIDEAFRRIIAVGGDINQIGGVDNYCWPNIQFHPKNNPGGKHKAAQLVRSCKALSDICLSYNIPLLSGKDSMYVDGFLEGKYGETIKVSGLETLQFSTIGVVNDVKKCVTMDNKAPDDIVYIIGETMNELGASEYYSLFNFTGINVPKVLPDKFIKSYKTISNAIDQELVSSVHGIYRGGLGVHLSLVAMGGGLGMEINLASVLKSDDINRNDFILFSESSGRFIVTVNPFKAKEFESLFYGVPISNIGEVTDKEELSIYGLKNEIIINLSINEIKKAWKSPFGDLV